MAENNNEKKKTSLKFNLALTDLLLTDLAKIPIKTKLLHKNLYIFATLLK